MQNIIRQVYNYRADDFEGSLCTLFALFWNMDHSCLLICCTTSVTFVYLLHTYRKQGVTNDSKNYCAV